MPYIESFTRPEQFMKYKGVEIFHVYKDDDVNQGEKTWEFTLDPTEDGHSFDVRDFDVPSHAGLDAHPPYTTLSNPEYVAATPEQKEAWKKAWATWYACGQYEAILAVLCEAIDLGLLGNPKTEDSSDSPLALTLKVTLSVRPNGTPPEELLARLRRVIEDAYSEGNITGDTPAEIDEMVVNVERL